MRLIGLLACSLLAAPPSAQAGATPGNLQGIWEREQLADQSDHPRALEIGEGVLKVDGEECAITGIRSLSDRRWYVDARCGRQESSAVAQFDLLLLDKGQLLLTRRILGTAKLYLRVRAGTAGSRVGQ